MRMINPNLFIFLINNACGYRDWGGDVSGCSAAGRQPADMTSAEDRSQEKTAWPKLQTEHEKFLAPRDYSYLFFNEI